MLENIYYVYIYLCPKTPNNFIFGKFTLKFLPFYVGKGKNNRAYHHLKEAEKIIGYCSNEKINKIRSLLYENKSPIINIISKELTHEQACSLEKELIDTIGRKDKGLGPLLNLTDGGEGSHKRIVSEDTRKKIGSSRIYPSGKNHHNHKDYDSTKHSIKSKTDKRVKRYFETDELAFETITDLYYNKKIPMRGISRMYSCSPHFINNRLYTHKKFHKKYKSEKYQEILTKILSKPITNLLKR